MEQLKKYQQQYQEFCNIDDFNLEDRAKRVPAEKHFWVCRLIDAKIEMDNLHKMKASHRTTLKQKILTESPIVLNEQVLNTQVDKSPSMDNINQKIKEHAFMIEYLEKLVNQITFIGNDIKNIISVKALQEQ
jgi:hypothetical protein